MPDIKENVITWITGDDYMVCDFTQRKYITKVLKMMDKQPSLVSNFVRNKDGSIHCHLPLKSLKLYQKTSDKRTFGNVANSGYLDEFGEYDDTDDTDDDDTDDIYDMDIMED